MSVIVPFSHFQLISDVNTVFMPILKVHSRIENKNANKPTIKFKNSIKISIACRSKGFINKDYNTWMHHQDECDKWMVERDNPCPRHYLERVERFQDFD